MLVYEQIDVSDGVDIRNLKDVCFVITGII